MKTFLIKFTKIYIPFLLTMIGTILLYTLFNWLIIIKLDWGTMSSYVVDFILPMLIVSIALLVAVFESFTSLYQTRNHY